jgi:hypothetical protein
MPWRVLSRPCHRYLGDPVPRKQQVGTASGFAIQCFGQMKKQQPHFLGIATRIISTPKNIL